MHKELDVDKIKEIYNKLDQLAPTDKPKFAFKKVYKTIKDNSETDFQILANPSGYIQYGLAMLKAVIESSSSDDYQIEENVIDFSHSDFLHQVIHFDETIIPKEAQERKFSGILGCIAMLIIVAIVVIGLKG